MDKQCEIVQDLLPLYIDRACSQSSSEMVSEHLKICPECMKVYEQMSSDESEKSLKKEKDSIIIRHERKEDQKIITCIFAAIALIYIPALFIIPLFAGGDAGFIATPYAFDLLVFFLYTVPLWVAFIEVGQLVGRLFEKRKASIGEKMLYAVGLLLSAGIFFTVFNLEELLLLSLLLASVILINTVIRAVVFKKTFDFLGVFKQKAFWICVLCLITAISAIIAVSSMFLSVKNVREETKIPPYSASVRECGSEYEGLFFDIGLEELGDWELLGKDPTVTVRWVNSTDKNINYDLSCYIYKQTDSGWGLVPNDIIKFPEGFGTVPAGRTSVQIYSIEGYDISESGRYRFVTYIDDKAIWMEFEVSIQD